MVSKVKRQPNQRAADNGGMALLFQVGHVRPAGPEHDR